jgi:hypothetical protein
MIKEVDISQGSLVGPFFGKTKFLASSSDQWPSKLAVFETSNRYLPGSSEILFRSFADNEDAALTSLWYNIYLHAARYDAKCIMWRLRPTIIGTGREYGAEAICAVIL